MTRFRQLRVLLVSVIKTVFYIRLNSHFESLTSNGKSSFQSFYNYQTFEKVFPQRGFVQIEYSTGDYKKYNVQSRIPFCVLPRLQEYIFVYLATVI